MAIVQVARQGLLSESRNMLILLVFLF